MSTGDGLLEGEVDGQRVEERVEPVQPDHRPHQRNLSMTDVSHDTERHDTRHEVRTMLKAKRASPGPVRMEKRRTPLRKAEKCLCMNSTCAVCTMYHCRSVSCTRTLLEFYMCVRRRGMEGYLDADDGAEDEGEEDGAHVGTAEREQLANG